MEFVQKVYNLIVTMVLGQIAARGNSVDVNTMQDIIVKQHSAPRCGERLFRWFVKKALRGDSLLPMDDTTVYDDMRLHNMLEFVSLYFLFDLFEIRDYIHEIRWTSLMSPAKRREDLNKITQEAPELPVMESNLTLLEFLINRVDVVDLFHPGSLEIRTEFLNVYEHKRPDRLTGGTIRLELLPSGTYRIIDVLYGGVLHSRAHLPETVASLLVSGITYYLTIATHAVGIHYQSGHIRAMQSHLLLPLSHPVRGVLLPTELYVTSTLGRGILSLLGVRGLFAQAYAYTFIGGLKPMAAAYRAWDPLQTTDPRTELIVGGTDAVHDVRLSALHRDYRRWWRYIHHHMTAIVGALYPTEASLMADHVLTTWLAAVVGTTDSLTRERLIVTMSLPFLELVRHNHLSSVPMSHVFRYAIILNPYDTLVSSNTLSIIASSATADIPWVPLVGRGFGDYCRDQSRICTELRAFYDGMEPLGTFAHSIETVHALPSTIEASCGY
jgi:hypothetical protein